MSWCGRHLGVPHRLRLLEEEWGITRSTKKMSRLCVEFFQEQTWASSIIPCSRSSLFFGRTVLFYTEKLVAPIAEQ